jgi:hypothetical protein
VRFLPALCVLLALLAGCIASNAPAADQPAPDAEAPIPSGHALANVHEPVELVAPTFRLLGAIAAGGPVYGAGEPSAWAGQDGALFVAFPGCDRAFYLVGLPTDTESCGHGLIYRSDDDGAAWQRLNRDGDGRYTSQGPAANGDADVAVDAAGNVYASNLGSGIQFHTLWAQNDTWEYMANVVPEGEGADRQWMAAGREGHVIMTWMRTSPSRDVEVNVTFDGGRTWTHAGNYGDGIGWLGTVQIAPDGEHAYIPYTQPKGGAVDPVLGGGQTCGMHVLRSADGGLTWGDIDTGARWPTAVTGAHWSCVHMAPGLDVTGDGNIAIAWSQDSFVPEDQTPYNLVSMSSHLYVIASRDGGTTWTEPAIHYNAGAVAGFGARIMPWLTGGAGDRLAIVYLYNPVPTD